MNTPENEQVTGIQRLVPTMDTRISEFEGNASPVDSTQGGEVSDAQWLGSDTATENTDEVDVMLGLEMTLDGPGGKPTGELTPVLQTIKTKKVLEEFYGVPFNLFPDPPLTVITKIRFDTAANKTYIYTQDIRCVKVGAEVGPTEVDGGDLEAYPAAGD